MSVLDAPLPSAATGERGGLCSALALVNSLSLELFHFTASDLVLLLVPYVAQDQSVQRHFDHMESNYGNSF